MLPNELHPHQLLSVHRRTICRLEEARDGESSKASFFLSSSSSSKGGGEQKKSMVDEMQGKVIVTIEFYGCKTKSKTTRLVPLTVMVSVHRGNGYVEMSETNALDNSISMRKKVRARPTFTATWIN